MTSTPTVDKKWILKQLSIIKLTGNTNLGLKTTWTLITAASEGYCWNKLP